MAVHNPFTDSSGKSLADEGQPDTTSGVPKPLTKFNPATTPGSPVTVNNPYGSLDVFSPG